VYEEFSTDYDRFVDWPARLAVEMPFIRQELSLVGARRVLDTACGTGMHTLALAETGCEAVGVDISNGMIDVARRNAKRERSTAAFHVAGFGGLADRTGGGFDALLCLGNSLPHVGSTDELATALRDFRACLRPGGLALIQNRNFDAVLARGDRWMGPQAHCEGDREWLFVRFYDFLNDGALRFNVMTLHRDDDGPWSQRIGTARLWPLRRLELATALDDSGFGDIQYWGDMEANPFDEDRSPNLVVAARATGCRSEPRYKKGKTSE
jgi:SAM-dependent methyltransferase